MRCCFKGKMIVCWFLALFLLLNLPCSALAQNIPDAVRNAIEDRFPGAEIKEIESEQWKGRAVTEVELTTRSGTAYEVFVSDSGEILHIEEEKGLPWIGGELSIGLGLRGEQEVYRDADSEFEPIPFFVYENGPFEIQGYDGIDVTYRLYGDNYFEAGLLGTLVMEGGYDTDDDYFEGMDELDSLLYDAGITLEVNYAGWQAALTSCRMSVVNTMVRKLNSPSLTPGWSPVLN